MLMLLVGWAGMVAHPQEWYHRKTVPPVVEAAPTQGAIALAVAVLECEGRM